jgi:hypothetical protein
MCIKNNALTSLGQNLRMAKMVENGAFHGNSVNTNFQENRGSALIEYTFRAFK